MGLITVSLPQPVMLPAVNIPTRYVLCLPATMNCPAGQRWRFESLAESAVPDKHSFWNDGNTIEIPVDLYTAYVLKWIKPGDDSGVSSSMFAWLALLK